MLDLTDKIIQFESGEISEQDFLSLFSELIKSGLAWSLQGFYGRTAAALIDQGIIDKKGVITLEKESES